MRSHIKHLHHSLGVTTIYVTHDQIEAMTLADRVVVMSKAEIQQIGTPEQIYNDPSNLFVAGFIGSPAMNLVEGNLVNGTFEAVGQDFVIKLPGFASISQKDVVLGVRAEDLTLGSPSTAAIVGDVFTVELTGEATLVTLKLGHQFITAKADKTYCADIGEREGFMVAAAQCYLFDSTTQLRLQIN
jgi:multiple sugar transport system ATP-binding protein